MQIWPITVVAATASALRRMFRHDQHMTTPAAKTLDGFQAEGAALEADRAEFGPVVADAFAAAETAVAFGDADDAFEAIFGSPVDDEDLA